jgi:hypothetical protein
MTLFGKLLVFLNLIVGMGIAIWSTVVYTQRPAWFDPAPDAVDKGNAVLTFKGFQAETDLLSRAAASQSKLWGDQLKAVQDKERFRDRRRVVFFGPEGKDGKRSGGWLDAARNGDKNGVGFYDPVYRPDGLIDAEKRGKAVVGPGGEPLRGSETLMERYNTDVKAVTDLLGSIEKLRAQQEALGKEIVDTEGKIFKQGVIRDEQQNELFILSGFEINWYEQRETVRRRKVQLTGRLATFEPMKP